MSKLSSFKVGDLVFPTKAYVKTEDLMPSQDLHIVQDFVYDEDDDCIMVVLKGVGKNTRCISQDQPEELVHIKDLGF